MNTISHPFAIRRATISDSERVARCVAAAYTKWIPVIGRKPGPMLDDYREVITRETVFVVEQTCQVIGLLVLSEDEDGFLLENVAVHPSASGRGIGRKLLVVAEDEARARGFAEIHLYTHELMVSNIEFYERIGYVAYAHRVESGYARVYMCKKISG